MKKSLSFIFVIILILSAFSGCTANEKTDIDEPAPPIIEDDTEKAEEKTALSLNSAFYPKYQSFSEYDAMRKKLADWFMQKVENGEIFSATIGSVGGAELRQRLEKDVKTSSDESGNTVVTATYLDGETGVQFTLDGTLYFDNPTVDYVIHVTNTSKKKSPIIKNLYALDTSFDIACDGEYTLHTNQGSNEKAKDFEPIIEKITGDEKEKHIFAPMKGSSSYDNAFPFFDVIGKDEGLILAIGWSGTWESEFAKTGDNTVNMKARQQNFSSVLLADETIRTPSIVLTYFDGDYDYGHNVWRRCVIEHYTPSDGSEDRFVAPMSLNTWGGRTAKSMIKCFEAYKEYDADLWWIDAGWYSSVPGPDKPDGTVMNGSADSSTIWHQWLGVWSENRNLFPKGIKQVADYIHENSDLRFMLWWMIEDGRGPKADQFTFGLGRYYQIKNKDGSLAYAQALRLDDDKVADYLINYFKGYIDKKGIDCVRLDKSITLASLWEDYDARRSGREAGKANSRKGITEAKYINNFYRIWDTLYEYHEGFLLDNCSSGGRRIDIEMTKRSIPLWRTDYSSYEETTQAMTQYLSAWLPLTASGCMSGESYRARSYYSACTCVSVSELDKKSVDAKKKYFDEFVELRPYWYGDYYQLMEPSSDDRVWQAYELYRADKHEGMAVAIRRTTATLATQMLKLKGLVPDREYKVHDIDDSTGETDMIMTGKELMERGIPARLAIRTIKCFEFTLVTDKNDSYYE